MRTKNLLLVYFTVSSFALYITELKGQESQFPLRSRQYYEDAYNRRKTLEKEERLKYDEEAGAESYFLAPPVQDDISPYPSEPTNAEFEAVYHDDLSPPE